MVDLPTWMKVPVSILATPFLLAIAIVITVLAPFYYSYLFLFDRRRFNRL